MSDPPAQIGEPGMTMRWSQGEGDIEGALAVRVEVFCREQGVPIEMEMDGMDGQAEHLVAVSPGEGGVIGTLRLLAVGDTAKVGRVAVLARWRRRGIALAMLAMALERAGERGLRRARLAAQLEAVELYRRAGFAVESEEFEEAGIMHVWMGRDLGGRRTGERD